MGAGHQPDLSIVITSYNYAGFLPTAIASASSQHTDLDIVIVDNASTDSSWDLIQAAAARDPRIRAFRNDRNIGLIGNHQRGLELATGRRVLFLSADDFLLPGHVARTLAMHVQYPHLEAIFSSYFQVDAEGRLLRYLGHPGHLRGSYAGGRNEFASLLTYDCYTCLPTTLFDRDYLLSTGFDPEINAFDYELYLRMARDDRPLGYLHHPGACIRVHGNSASGEDRYVATGKQLLEHVHVLERHLVPETATLIAGHERGVAAMLAAKLNNLHGYPETAGTVLPPLQPRIESLAKTIASFAEASAIRPLPPEPVVSIVMVATDLHAALRSIEHLQRQTYRHIEPIIALAAPFDAAPMLEYAASGMNAKILRVDGTQNRSAILNDALRLVTGDIVAYLDETTTWPTSHTERIARTFVQSRIDALIVPIDVVATRSGADVARFSKMYGATKAEAGARVGEAVPLASLAHRSAVVDRVGMFDEQLRHLAPFDFIQRLFSSAQVGVDENDPIVQRRRVEQLHSAISDPSGYASELTAIYNARPVDASTTERRNAHVATIVAELNALANVPSLARAHAFDLTARGSTEFTRSAGGGRRLLVIDDCVPYNELGRGYPRARTILEDLVSSGYEVLFYPLVTPFDSAPMNYGVPGVDILYGRGRELLAHTLVDLLPSIDVLWVSRPHNMSDVANALRDIPKHREWALVYDAEAVYAERDRVRALLSGTVLAPPIHASQLERELALTNGCDVVSAVSSAERALIEQRFTGSIEVLPFSIAPTPTSRAFHEREGLLFVGAIEPTSPNDDALRWFLDHVSPQLGPMPIRHAGVMQSPDLAAHHAVEFLGMVSDLHPVYDAARIFIIPTRFAAGLPQKAYEAAAHGLPIIATPLIASQLGWNDGVELLVADSPGAWASAIARLSTDAGLWQELRVGALRRVQAEVAPDAFRSKCSSIVSQALAARRSAASGSIRR